MFIIWLNVSTNYRKQLTTKESFVVFFYAKIEKLED